MQVFEGGDWIIETRVSPDLLSKMQQEVDNPPPKTNIMAMDNYTVSTRGKGSIQLDVREPNQFSFFDEYKSFIYTKTIAHRQLNEDTKFVGGACWIVNSQRNSWHAFHKHVRHFEDPSAFSNHFSSLCYVRVPVYNPTSDLHGGLFGYVVRDETIQGLSIRYITPEPGMLLIFSPSLLHGVYPQRSGTRQCLNYEFYLKDK